MLGSEQTSLYRLLMIATGWILEQSQCQFALHLSVAVISSLRGH